jgi:D-alanine-D-alanine ligase
MNIIVLCGGLSAERDVSITSGTMVAAALRRRGHKAVLVDLFFGYPNHYENPKDIFNVVYGEYNDGIAAIGRPRRTLTR